MNPQIILAGQAPDIVGAMRQGNAAAAETNALRAQNALSNLYRTQGADIMAGKPQALNALAGLDPTAALGIQDARLGMDARRLDMQATRQSMDMLSAQEQRQIAEFKATASAAEAAAAAAQIEDAVKMGLAIQDPAQWDAVMSQQAPELVGQFANRQALAMKYMTMAEALKAATPEQPNMADRYKVVGSTLYDLQADGGPAVVGQGQMQEETIFGPDGKPMIVRGGAGAGARFTEAQSKDNVYATRAEGALAELDPVAGELTSLVQRGAEIDPTGVVRGAVQTDNFQTAQRAGREFLQAILRKDTGAAITAQEEELYGAVYLPQLGDNKAVLEAKRIARARAVEAIKAGMNIDQVTATQRALVETAQRTGSTTPQAQSIPQGAIDILRQNDTPEYRAFFDEVFGQGAAARALGGN